MKATRVNNMEKRNVAEARRTRCDMCAKVATHITENTALCDEHETWGNSLDKKASAENGVLKNAAEGLVKEYK
jgi:hypothetical protein